MLKLKVEIVGPLGRLWGRDSEHLSTRKKFGKCRHNVYLRTETYPIFGKCYCNLNTGRKNCPEFKEHSFSWNIKKFSSPTSNLTCYLYIIMYTMPYNEHMPQC